jgi:predicted nuclease of predicted toxin-antitoxin system
MNILFDQNTPRKLRRHLTGHLVTTALAMGWDRTVNGELIRAAKAAGFEVFLTCDQNLSYQQDLSGRKIAIVELTSNNWTVVKMHIGKISQAVNSCVAGSYIRVICGE